MPSFGPDGILDGLPTRGERGVEFTAQRRGGCAVLPRALQQPRDEGWMNVLGKTWPWHRPRLESAGHDIGAPLMRSTLRENVSTDAQVFEQRQLQRARPRPQLANRQRRHRLECRDEAVQPLRVQIPRAAADQLER